MQYLVPTRHSLSIDVTRIYSKYIFLLAKWPSNGHLLIFVRLCRRQCASYLRFAASHKTMLHQYFSCGRVSACEYDFEWSCLVCNATINRFLVDVGVGNKKTENQFSTWKLRMMGSAQQTALRVSEWERKKENKTLGHFKCNCAWHNPIKPLND